MAEEKEEKEEKKEETKEEKKRDLFKLILIGTQVLTLVIVIVLGVLYFKTLSLVTSQKASSKTQQPETQEVPTTQQKVAPKKEVIYHLDPFVVNLLDEEGTRFLKVTIDLVVDSDKTKDEIDDRLPEIRDAIISCLSNHSFKEIADVTGKMYLKEEIKRKLNSMLESGSVKKVLFTEFIVQ